MAFKDILFLNDKVHQRLHPWPLEAWPGHFSGQNILPVHENIVTKSESDFATMFLLTGQVFWPEKCLEVKGASTDGLFCWETKYSWRPLEAKSDFATRFLWTGKVFWPEKCPGHVSRGEGCERRRTFLLRNKISLEAIRGQIRFCNNVFMNRPSILARNMPWSGL